MVEFNVLSKHKTGRFTAHYALVLCSVLFLTLPGCSLFSSGISESYARQSIEGSSSFKARKNVPLALGRLSTEETGTNFYRILESLGLIRIARDKKKGVAVVSLTEKGRLASRDWIWRESIHVWLVPVFQRRLSSVVGVRKEKKESLKVEFSWRWAPDNALGRYVPVDHTLYRSLAPFLLYHNKWQLQEGEFEQELQETDG
ncbi:MAG: hypothetical protein HYU64_12245 [Armatimonadetes bacterium]|nr:hypothetical protein [Armatimonadota bacterium]